MSYANYAVQPRSVLQSLPVVLQRKYAAVMEEIEAECEAHKFTWPSEDAKVEVCLKNNLGWYVHDPFADYERGRRRLW